MTIIVYDGKNKTITADSMTTQRTPSSTARVQNTWKVTDLSKDNLKFKDEKLLAFAGAGVVLGIKRAFDFIITYFDKWAATVRKLEKAGLDMSSFQGCSVLLITSKRVIDFRFMVNNVKIIEHDRNVEFVAIGSGAPAALTAMRVFGLNGPQAALVAAFMDAGCGTVQTTFDVKKDRLVQRPTVAYEESIETLMALRKLAGKSAALYGPEPSLSSPSVVTYDGTDVQNRLDQSDLRKEEKSGASSSEKMKVDVVKSPSTKVRAKKVLKTLKRPKKKIQGVKKTA